MLKMRIVCDSIEKLEGKRKGVAHKEEIEESWGLRMRSERGEPDWWDVVAASE